MYTLKYHQITLLTKKNNIRDSFKNLCKNKNNICIALLFQDKTKLKDNILKIRKSNKEYFTKIFLNYVALCCTKKNIYSKDCREFISYQKKFKKNYRNLWSIIEDNFKYLKSLKNQGSIDFVVLPWSFESQKEYFASNF